MKAKLGKIVKTTKLNYIQLVGDIQCVNIAKYVVQPWCKKEKEKCKCLKNQALAFCLVPGAAVEIINLTKIILN